MNQSQIANKTLTPEQDSAYDPSPIIKPPANLSAWLWLLIIGIPFLLLVFIYAKLSV